MEKVTILGANGRPIGQERQARSKESILLGKANGAFMNCTRESIQELQEERQERLRKNREEHRAECMSVASDMMPVRLAGFENPYDELNNLLLIAYNNTFAANGLLYSVCRMEKEKARLYQKLRTEQTAKDIACEFITSRGYTEEFRKFCEEQAGRTQSGTEPQYEVRTFAQ